MSAPSSLFGRTVEEYKDWLLNNSREQLEFILLDLIRLSENKEILCDCHLTVAQTLAFSEPSRVVFLIKEPSNLVDEYGNRPDHQGFLRYLNSATDVEKAKQTVNTTLYEINVNRIEEIKNSDFFWIERTGDSTVEDTLSRVEKHLGLIQFKNKKKTSRMKFAISFLAFFTYVNISNWIRNRAYGTIKQEQL